MEKELARLESLNQPTRKPLNEKLLEIRESLTEEEKNLLVLDVLEDSPAPFQILVAGRLKKSIKKNITIPNRNIAVSLSPNVATVILSKLKVKPDWYKLGVDVIRDDVFDGFAKMFPGEIKGVGWVAFWDTMAPLIQLEPYDSMYIRLKDLWANAVK